ncbi:MAG: ABC transporter substrate-binding protein [Caldilineaceae bacterium]|nr:ABC transporter substrate-binding protein [Caldilineaceae bacterium]MCY3990903.1 ABC transporter substrate-binding protein [Caldilineaceae bacterium]MDE0311209.1 ABC transporter substrate-binding protein [Caldilineaceae bacterium]
MKKTRLSRRDFLSVSATTAAGVMLTACVPAAVPSDEPAAMAEAEAPAEEAAPMDGGTLTFSTGSPWGTFSPFRPTYQYGYSSNTPAMLTHSRLFDLDRNNDTHPNLALEWEISDDATVYSFRLREDAKWHDGEPVTANDVVSTVRFILTQATNINPRRWISALKGGQDFYDGVTDELPGVYAPDDFNVVFELEETNVGWHLSATTDLQILPAHIFDGVAPEDIVEHHAPAWYTPELNIGSGPFKFVRAERDQFVELVRNDDYYGGTPKLERIIFKNFGAADTQFIALQKGELDVWNVPQDFYEQSLELDNVDVHLVNRNYIRVFLLNYESPVLADKRVRQALAYAIDREGICEGLYSGLCTPYNSYMEMRPWLADGLNQYEYNPEKAKELLAAAEADGTWDPSNVLRVNWYYSDALHQDIMAAIQQNLAAVGVETQLQYLEGTSAVETQSACEFEMYYQGWGFSFPEQYNSFFTDAERCRTPWGDPDAQALFNETATTVNLEERMAIHEEIQRRLNDELPMMPFLQFIGPVAVNKRVQGFNEDALWNRYYPWSNGYANAVNWAVTG